MTVRTCPRCGWPVAELTPDPGEELPTSGGRVGYRRCVCGSWLVVLDGIVAGSTRIPGGLPAG
ncbi:hypothetical protein CFN78_11535 [Amycolatopsis antarctica]|uniref:Uncharacterized protein n=1 Tax=Amycolatopsis antarctica TaxID=1854586 RepID=A0A263D491_9PSEU|nr:hypothetical protein [Amycolatopsis antarctica]OZM72888.1 hypothetical protein CFN78_11535 [Amycolatopsis antarctica]